MKKYIAAFMAAVSVLLLLAGCGSAAKEVDVDVIVNDVVAAVNSESQFSAAPDSYIKGSMKMDVSGFQDYAVEINAVGANIDEFGIFRGSDSAQTKEIRAAVEEYLQMRIDSWMEEYMPEEKPKLTDAEVRVSGNYVMYCILSDDAKTAAFNAFESALK